MAAKQAIRMRLYLFLKLVQINVTFFDNVHILYIHVYHPSYTLIKSISKPVHLFAFTVAFMLFVNFILKDIIYNFLYIHIILSEPSERCSLSHGRYLCRDEQQCINITKVCNHVSDCHDSSDEGDKCGMIFIYFCMFFLQNLIMILVDPMSLSLTLS